MWKPTNRKFVATPTGDLVSLVGALKPDNPIFPKTNTENRTGRTGQSLCQKDTPRNANHRRASNGFMESD